MPEGDQASGSQLRARIAYYVQARIGADDDPRKIAFLLRGMVLEISVLADSLLEVEFHDNAPSAQSKATQIKAIADLVFQFADLK